MKKIAKFFVILLLVGGCLSAFAAPMSSFFSGIRRGSVSDGGFVIAGDSPVTTAVTRSRIVHPHRRIDSYERSGSDEVYLPDGTAPDLSGLNVITMQDYFDGCFGDDVVSFCAATHYVTVSSSRDFFLLSVCFDNLVDTTNLHLFQTCDIDFSDGSFDFYIGCDEAPFRGSYHGCGFRLIDPFVYAAGSTFPLFSVFGYADGASFDGVVISASVDVSLEDCIFGFCGLARDCSFDFCYLVNSEISGSVECEAAGVFVGICGGETSFEHCYVLNSELSCPAFVGKVCSSDDFGEFSLNEEASLYFTESVNAANLICDGSFAGGFVGSMDADSGVYFSLCSNYGNIADSEGRAGGFIAEIPDYSAHVWFFACINYGRVSSGDCAGGFVGYSGCWDLQMEYCVNYGEVFGSHASGGLIGSQWLEGAQVNFENCVNAGEVDGFDAVGGLFGDVLAYDYDGGFFGTSLYLYNLSVPGQSFIGAYSDDTFGEYDAEQLQGLCAGSFFYHDLLVPEDIEILRDGSDGDILFYEFLTQDGSMKWFWSGEHFYPGKNIDGYWHYPDHQVAVCYYEYEFE